MNLYMPVSYLDDLIAATGFVVGQVSTECKYSWLLERIRLMRADSEMAAIIHDNPKHFDLVAVIQRERQWSACLQNTIAMLQARMKD